MVILACVGLGIAAIARHAGSTAPEPSTSTDSHLGAVVVLLVGIAVLVFAPLVAILWPRPDIPGGWCGSGAIHDGYTIVTVTQTALVATLIAAPCVVAAAAMLPRRRGERIAIAMIAGLAAAFSVLIVLAMLGYKVDCGGS
jgi:hypothetical protein